MDTFQGRTTSLLANSGHGRAYLINRTRRDHADLGLLVPIMQSANCYFQEYTNSNTFKYALKHKEIIERFGRFPHRNKVLGRNSTQSELEFLKLPGSRF